MIEINDKKRKLIKQISEKYNLELLLLFGSQVSGATHKESDYDVGFLSSRKLSFEEESQLFVDLLPVINPPDERLLSLAKLRGASPLLLYSATDKAQILFEKEPDLSFAKLRAYAFKKFIEAMPIFKMKAERLGLPNLT